MQPHRSQETNAGCQDARVPGVGARRATAPSGSIAHLAPQQPVAVVAEATFVGTAQCLQGLPAATLRRHRKPGRSSPEVPLVTKQDLESAAQKRGLASASGARTQQRRATHTPLPVLTCPRAQGWERSVWTWKLGARRVLAGSSSPEGF